MLWKYPDDFKRIFYKPGETAKYVWGNGILMALITIHSETEGSIHDCEQISWMVDGELELRIGDEVKRIKKGMPFTFPPVSSTRLPNQEALRHPRLLAPRWPGYSRMKNQVVFPEV